MSTKQQFFALAEKSGIEVDHEPETPWLQIWAPKGKIFQTSGCHVDASFQCLTTSTGNAHDWAACLAELRKVVATGLYDCPDGAECDHCND